MLQLQIPVTPSTIPMLLDLFGAVVLFEIVTIMVWTYRRIFTFLSVKSISLLSYVFGFSMLAVGHLSHAVVVTLNPEMADVTLRLFELASASLLVYPYAFRKRETVLTLPAVSSLIFYSIPIGLIASILFLYLSITFYRVYDVNKSVDTMLFSTSFMMLFISEVLVSLIAVPLVYSGYVARLISFILLLYFTVRVRK